MIKKALNILARIFQVLIFGFWTAYFIRELLALIPDLWFYLAIIAIFFAALFVNDVR